MSTKHNKIRPVYRPVFINLLQIKLPVSAFISITHRLSGVYNFFITLPLALYLLYFSTKSYNDFMFVYSIFNNPGLFSTFVTFSFLVYFYHLLTGFRHLLQDIHIGESLVVSRLSSYLVLFIWSLLFFVVMSRLYT
ncbi:MAG: succinate dehydrogenase, cytochrome b556 subunit [Gammaproteobacteria bacterium]